MVAAMTKLLGLYEIKNKFTRGKSKEFRQKGDICGELAEFFVYSELSLKNCSPTARLRKEINKIIPKNKAVVYEEVKEVVHRFLALLKAENCKDKAKTLQHMKSLFHCKCGWFLFSPVTLSCGHTLCKDCVSESMLCKFCGTSTDSSISTNHFLTDLIRLWFRDDYDLHKFKKESLELMKKREYNKALKIINTVIESQCDDYIALNIRSEINSKVGKFKAALSDAELSCKLYHNCGKSHFRRGLCYSDLGKLDDAIDAFQACLEVEPNDIELSNAVISNIDRILSNPAPNTFEIDEGDGNSTSSSNDSIRNTPSSEDLVEDKRTSKKSDTENGSTKVIKDQNMNEKVDIESNSGDSNISSSSKCHSDRTNSKSKLSSQSLSKKKEIIQKRHGVPENLITDEEVECKLCFEILYQPVTTKCGHVFCKRCLLRTLDHNIVCPICRLSLADYVRSVSKPATILVEEILSLFYNKQYHERTKSYNNRMKDLLRIGVDESVEIPIFVCSVAFPYVQFPLHIFEPRYRLMIRDCIESGSKKFGMCINVSGEMSDIGTICEVKKYQTLPDGRFIIHITAYQRFLVREKSIKESLPYAKVTYFKDEPEDLTSEQFSNSSKVMYNQLAEYINSLTTAEQDCIFNALGMLPNYSEDYDTYEHGMPWVWWGLAAVPLNLTAKLVLLRCKCVSERMLSLQRFLKFLRRLQPSNQGSSNSNNN